MSAPVERPIIFSGPMVQAILEGRKTQTRRLIKPQPDLPADFAGARADEAWAAGYVPVRCPFGVPGDRLWVRETFSHGPVFNADVDTETRLRFRANAHDSPLPPGQKWKRAIHMPRRASRLTLVVTGVRVQRLQEITEQDARAEGVAPYSGNEPAVREGPRWYRMGFQDGWDWINGKRAPWASNPWVWAITFEVRA